MKDTLLDVLVKARARIDKPQKWCAHWWTSDDERRLGADGAVWLFTGHGSALSADAMRVLADHSGINDLWPAHERVTYLVFHREVMAMFDGAIDELRQEMPA